MADRGITQDAGVVSRIDDQSGYAHHAVQSNLEMRPKIVDVDGYPMIEFDGFDDSLTLPAGFEDFPGLSFFAVVQALPHAGCAGILSFSNGDDTDDIELGRHRPNLLYYEVVGDFVEGTAEAFVTDRVFLASIIQTATGATTLRLDGELQGEGTIPRPAFVLRRENYFGRNAYDECEQPFHGRVAELLLYPRALTADEEGVVVGALSQRWGLPR